MLLNTLCQPAASWTCRLQLPLIHFRATLLAGALFLLFAADAGGTTYYVDSQNGNDNYDGQAAAFQSGNTGPWASITKVNSIFFAPGDSILFKRGATWTDGPLVPRIGGAPGNTITIQERIVGQPLSFELVDLSNNNCVYFGPYNEGPKPRIDCMGEQGIILGHDYLIFESFHLDNGGNNMLWFGKETGNYWNAVIDIDVTHCTGNAVASDFGGGNLWLKGLYVYDYEKNGILMNGSLNNQMKSVLIEDCWVENPVTLDLEDGITCHSDASGNNLDGDVIIRNNTIIRSGEDGVDITSGTNILVKGNDIRNSLAAGVFVAKSWVNTVEVSGNFLYSNSISQGVGDLTIRVPNVWAYNNVITGTGHHCLQLSNTDNTRIWHNVIAPESRTGNIIWLQDSIGQLEFHNNIFDFSGADQDISGTIPPNIVFDYNCYYNNLSTDNIYQNYSFQEYKNANPLFEPNGFFANPRFTGPGRSEPQHFQLQATSPCIDAGTPVAVTADFWNTPRPQDGGYDMGIYEQGTVDCDPDPNNIAYPGSPCDDGDPTTANDVYGTNCQCAGTPTACASIGDADADGVCSDVDCDDNDPNVAYQPGDACDDGDPTTSGETIQANCSCGGGTPGPATVCSVVNSSNDDAEEKFTGTMDIGSSDLELAYDPNRGHQVIGLRFNGLNIPQGATITSAHIQFTVDANINIDPSRLRIYGENSDDPLPFADIDYNVSTRPRTAASVNWAPPDWLTVASFGADQRTPDIYAIIQEIVNRPGYDSGNAIGILIDGIGGRTAESYDGFPAQAPKLCVEYTLLAPNYDCPFLSANIGHPCNDGDPSTVNDAIDADCNCIGTPTACTGIGDADGDGICADIDCDDNDFFTTTYPGEACDDGNNTTINDRINNNCQCAGTPTDCTGIGDNDGDGVCASVDCNDNDPNITSFTGQACDDGDNTTINDILDGNCNCAGAPTACTGIGDNDGDGVCANVDCDDNDPNITTQPGSACNDNDNTTLNDVIDANCNCAGTPTACTGIGDADGDGVCADMDCDDNDPNIITQPGSACNDGDNTTVNDIVDGNCNCAGIPTACTGIGDNDGDGICADVDCDDNDPSIITQPGSACNDGDNTTANDSIDANCNCAGTPTACTGIGDNDGDGVCADVDCDDNNPNITTQPGSACNDGDNTTINDSIDANCNCAGTPTACTGIGDNDGDGVCADVDCNDNDPNNTNQPGSACNDGDNTTINDSIDANCNCAGTPTACTGIGDNDGDGVCADVDCDDNDSNNTTQPGNACNDGDNTTINDMIDANCNCVGTPTTCTGIGDSDGDGICADVDCDDNDPNNTAQPGDACNDGNPDTVGETLQSDCSCGGGVLPLNTCSRVSAGSDDAEEDNGGSVSLTSSDLELADDSGEQIVGMRFNGLNIPQGATITSARIQFTVDETRIVDPCNLTIRGEASDDAASFSSNDNDISNRPTTGTSVAWAPPSWSPVGAAEADQQTPEIASVIQEIVSRSGFSTSSSIVLIIDGTGRRAAESYNGSTANAPELCVEYILAPDFDCPAQLANVGNACNDGDNTTFDDVIDANCNCAGTPTACTGIGDNDGDGVCADVDCDDNDSNNLSQPGDACNDGDNTTFDDIIDANCTCAGTPTACTGIGDQDGDGVCADVDCDDNNPGITTQPGDACNDGDHTTFDDRIDANCNCNGTPTACTGIGDNDGDGICADVDCDDNDPDNTAQPGDACDDGDNTTFNDLIDANCNCAGTPTACTGIGDNDGDGICTDVDCDDNDPGITTQPGDACNDGNNTTFNDTIDVNCNCAGTPTACTGIGDNDGDGVCADVDCDDNDPNNTAQPGDACNDGDNTTLGDTIDANCNCVGTPNACNGIGDNDGDGVCANVDCDDDDPNVTSQIGDACNDGDNTTINDMLDANCNCNGTPTACTGIGDNDNDGICADVDCDDNNPNITTQPGDACNDGDHTTINDVLDANCNCAGTPTACTGIGDSDGDGICADVDCDDNNPNITTQPGGACNDGNNTTINDVLDANCNCAGTPTACTGIGDNDGDGICTDVDCDDNNPNINTQPGDACNDGDNTTINDVLDANCNCAGTPTACTGIGDNDGDGICTDVDCDDNNPNINTQPGDTCNDGDNTTINDVLDTNCNCAGTPTACTGIGDNDNDGICADVDCDDNDPNNTTQPGDACNDGDPTTVDDFVQQDCTCSGSPAAPTATCSRVSASNDDAEEDDGGSVSLTSSDLELVDDSGEQTVGMRFTGLNIPQGALITNATIQFTVDETRNLDPCNLTIRGEASDDASSFSSDDNDISSRPTTGASVAWAPQSWSPIGVASADQQTPDIASIIQEVVNRSGFSDGSSIVLLINGTGRRVAESYNGSPLNAPELCVEYLLVAAYDCPALSANIGDACDDGDNTTTNDVIDANCGCTGTPTACTGIGDNDGDGICADVDCDDNNASITAQPGDTCNDDDNTTTNDVLDANCNCNGTPTTCTGIGDNDGDGICADVDCDDNNPAITTQPGDACDDGENTTTNDVLDTNCNCNGTSTTCTGIGDNDGDGICADVDCDDNNPAITTQPGDACDDGDNTTTNDVLDTNCNCNGTSTTCTGIGDNDGDGICADVDCDDNNANITSQVGDSCDDGDNATINDVLDANCNCSGSPALPTSTCSRISAGDDDAEEDNGGSVSLTSSDLELVDDSGDQTVGMRFNGLNIPQGALITSASIQFTVDETRNLDPCNLTIRGEASDDASSFSSNDHDISSRPTTGASVAWAPQNWSPIGIATPDQQTPDIASVIQEVVNRNGYTAASSIVLLIDGTGRRVAESYNGSPPNAPELCVEYLLVAAYDCPALSANTGDACDDGDNTTINDVLDANCNCVGTPTACTGIGDNDGDGICSDVDCNDNNSSITNQPGSACTDGDPTTINDIVDADCNCAGTPTACTGIGDNDGDGICSNVDCNDNDPNITAQAGDACDDGDPTTINDIIDVNCNCVGTPTACTGIGDNDNDGICADVDCNDNDPGITTQPGDACDDGDPNTTGDFIQQDCSCSGVSPTTACSKVSSSNDDAEEDSSGSVDLSSSDLELVEDPNEGIQVVGMRFNNLNIPSGANISHAYIQFTVDETRIVDPCNLSIYGEAADNAAVFSSSNGNISSRPRTNAMVGWNPQNWGPVGNSGPDQQTPDLAPIIQEVVGRSGYTSASSIVLLVEGIGRRTAESFDGSAAQAPELCVEYTSSSQMARPQGSMSISSTQTHPATTDEAEPISQLSIYPNPAKDRISVSFFSAIKSPVRWQVASLRGQTLLKGNKQVYEGINTISLEDLSLPNGIYFLQLYANGFIIPVKFAIQRN